MTEFQQLLAALEARGRVAARSGMARASAEVAARAAALPGVAVEVAGDEVRLTARGLRARAFGSRRAAGDPRLAGLVR